METVRENPIAGKTCDNCGRGFHVRMNVNGRRRRFCSWPCAVAPGQRFEPHRKIDIEVAVHMYFIENKSLLQIAAYFHASPCAVRIAFRRRGYKLRAHTRQPWCIEPGCSGPKYYPNARCYRHWKIRRSRQFRDYHRRKFHISPERWRYQFDRSEVSNERSTDSIF